MSFSSVRTRFAPSPTGFMHVGNLRTALYAYLLAKSQGGKFILRIEDTDQNRFVKGATEVIYKTLAAAGLLHDEGPDKDGGFGPYIQSQRKSLYMKYALELIEKGAAYYCFCDKTDEETDDHHENEISEKSEINGYDGRCSRLPQAEIQANLAAGKPFVIRQKIDKSGETSFSDSVFGEITIANKVLDDQILIKRDGLPTYNFANVVDDHLMEISHVVRGAEYLPSTPKYNLLYQSFGWDIPTYVHLPLIMGRGADGSIAKLSKRHGSVSFENLTAEGYLPDAIINYIALLGWSPKSEREIFTIQELVEAFNLSGLNKSAAVFDYTKLKWMNGEYVKSLPLADFITQAAPFAKLDDSPLQNRWPEIAELLHSRVALYKDIPEMIEFLRKLPDYSLELYTHKKNKSTPGSALTILQAILPEFEALQQWNRTEIEQLVCAYAERNAIKLGPLMWPVRIAVSGLAITPGGAIEIMDILGKQESIARLKAAIARLQEIQ